MVRVLLNTSDHHAHGSAGKGATVFSTATGEQYTLSPDAVVDDSSVLGSHRCRVFEMASLLTDARWLGTSVLHIELTSSDRPHALLFCHRLRQALAGLVDLKLTLVNNHTVRLSEINIQHAAVDAAQLMPLAEQILMVEVEKARNWRAKIHPAATAASSSSSAADGSVSPFHPSSLTGPTHPMGASNCCTLLHGRGDFLAAITGEVAAAVRAGASLKRSLKTQQAEKEVLYEDEAEKQAKQKELAEAEEAEMAIAAQEAAAAAAAAASAASSGSAADASLSSAASAAAAAASSKPSPPLSTRVRTHLSRTEAHHQRLVQVLQSELGSISLMHTCNVCSRVLRIEGEKTPAAPAPPAVAAGGGAGAAQRGVGEAQLQMLRELSLHAARHSDASSSAASSAAAFAGIAAAAASAAHSAVPSAPGVDAPLLSVSQVHARLSELQAKLRAASGSEAKARRKKIAKKIQELRGRYAQVIREHHLGGPDAELF